MEYSPTEELEDRASQAFWCRSQPVPEFTVTEEAGVMVIETPHLLLRYALSARGFTPVNLAQGKVDLARYGLTPGAAGGGGERGEELRLRGTG